MDKAQHICMLTVDHSPLDNRIYYQEAQSLQKAGFKVSIICVSDSDGYVHNMGWNKILNPNKETEFDLDGIKVYVIPPAKSFLERYRKKFLAGGFYKRFIKKGIELNADAYHAHEPETLFLANSIGKKNNAKVIFDAHESWAGGSKKDKIVKKFYLKQINYLITANELTRGNLLHQNMWMNTEVIYNYPRPDILEPKFNPEKLSNPIIVHEGHIPFNRGLKEILMLVKELQPKFPKIKLKIVGTGPQEEIDYIERFRTEHKLEENIDFTGWIPYLEIGKELDDCSIGLITKTFDVPNNVLGGPGIKIFNYFAKGIATIDVGLHESTRLLDKYEAGISLKNRTLESLKSAVELLLTDKELLEKYCTNAYKASQECSWETEAKKLVTFYSNKVFSQENLVIR